MLVSPLNADDSPPYIYYYSYAENAFLVERADGTDTRIFAASILDEAPITIVGPGWSPNGE